MSFLDDKVFVQREKKGRERGMEGEREREREEGLKERKTERQGKRERERERKRILDEGQTQRDREGYCECV